MHPTAAKGAAAGDAGGVRQLGGVREHYRYMKFDIYGRFELEVLRESDGWVAYRIGLGIRSPESDVVIPSSLEAQEVAVYLDDLFQRALAGPGQKIRPLR